MAEPATENNNALTHHDHLLDALVATTRLHHMPFSAASLTAGLPLESGKLTPSLYVRAAEQAGFSADVMQKSLEDIPSLVLPVCLVLDSGEACILLERKQDQLLILLPGEGAQEVLLSEAELDAKYTGQCIYCKPDHSLSADKDPTTQLKEDHWFWQTIRRSKGIYGEVLVASFLINLFALVSPLFIMNVYDRVVPNQAIDTLWVLASGALLAFVFDFILKSLRGYFIDIAGKRADILLSAKTFSKVLDIKMDQRPARVGSFANNLQEFDGFREFFTSSTIVALIDLPFVILFLIIIYSVAGSLVMVPLVAIPLILLACWLVQGPLQEVIQSTFSESSKKQAMLIESLGALDAIKGARAEGLMQKRWEDFNARLARLSLKSRLLTLITVNFTQTVQQLASVAVVISGVYLILDGELTVGALIASTILTGRCLVPMGQVAGILTRYHHSMASYSAMNHVMSLPVERPLGKKFLHRSHLGGDLSFRDVSFSYPEQQVAALSHLNLNIKAGEKIAIIGKMGSGKSTLQRLIMNFYTPQEGTVLVSGTDINQLDPIDLRRNIIYVPQDNLLMTGSIRENIVMGTPLASDEEVLKAAEFAGLAEFINEHPQGFDLQVGERGVNLSGGQRQAIAVARAFIHDAPILLLDEPTSAMDSAAEGRFRAHLTRYSKDKTLILITHKSTMLSLVDRIIVLNNGQLAADGPRDEILKALSQNGNGAA